MHSRLFPQLLFCILALGFLTGGQPNAQAQETATVASAPRVATSSVRPNLMFADNMVMQRNMLCPVWGEGVPGENIKVSLNGKEAVAVVDKQGKWTVKLGPFEAGGPFEMSIAGKSDTVTLKNVMIGEVWYCSGQSNMWWSVKAAKDGDAEVAAANHPDIRLFTVPQKVSTVPLSSVESGSWVPCSPETVPGFSAAAYYFGRALQEKLKVPVGLINSSWGGTLVYSWSAMEDLKADPDFSPAVKYFGDSIEHFHQLHDKGLVDDDGRYLDPGLQPNEKGWEATDLDDTAWKEMSLPQKFDDAGGKVYIDGAIWFRKEIDLPANMMGELELRLGNIGNYDITYFNGVEVGRMDAKTFAAVPPPSPRRSYKIPATLVKSGKNVIAVRVFNTSYHGGILGFGGWGNPPFAIRPRRGNSGFGDGINLTGPWKYKVGINYNQQTLYGITKDHRLPTCLFNGMVAPVIPFAIRGVIWYQGESDGPIFNNQQEALAYRKRFQSMISGWRRAWGEGDFPFMFVQLANFGPVPDKPDDGHFPSNALPILRESQTAALTLPQTAMAVAIDIGEEKNIHFPDKQSLGVRLALNAITLAYGDKVEGMGPVFKSMKVEGNKIRISFDHVGTGLEAKGGPLQRFAIAGEDRKFAPADAVIEGQEVVVSSPQVPKPTAVRYAWAPNPAGCNLYNKEGLPASPFRTDTEPAAADLAADRAY